MEFSIATLLANFTNDKLVAAKGLEKKLNCQDESCLKRLYIALDLLEKVGILVKERGKYRRVPEEGVIEAKLRCSSKGFCFAIQEAEGAEDIYIRESHLSTAWNGDRVLVKLTKEGSRRRSPEGEVQLILERSNQSLLARVKQTDAGFRAIPLDDRLLFEINLQPNGHNLAEAINHLIHVEIQRYPLGQYPPIGRVVKILGSDAEAAADVDLVSCKHDLPQTFSAPVLEAASLPSQLSKTDLKGRVDLRSLLTLCFNSSPPHPTLIENAFTLEKTTADQWQLGVHIADVAYYITPESPLDREALKRGSCVYLGETVLPLFPEAVEQHCSLLPGSDRLAISVLLTLDSATGQLVEFEIQPTVIQVDHQLSEQQVQAILSGQSPETSREESSNSLPAAVGEMLDQLSALSQLLQAQRQQRGSFDLKLPPRQYSYYDEGVLGVFVLADSTLEARLKELIVMANQVVATHLQALGVPAIYRVQPAPDLEDVQEMIKLASNLGVELRLEQEDVVQPADFKRFTEQFAQSGDSEQVLTYLLQATLKPAVYSTMPQPHFGLALPTYTHSNSPLRRYPDLLIQGILHTLFEQGRDRRTTRAKESVNLRHSSSHGNITWNVLPPEEQQELETDLARIIVQLNDREKEVQEAEDDLAGLQKAQLMKQRTGDVFQGLITGVQSYGFFVEIEVPDANGRPVRVEGLVHVSSLKDDWYEYRARQQALFGRKNRASYRLGDRVAVQVKSVDYYRQQIDLVTVNGEQQLNGEEASDELEEFPDDNDLMDEPESYFDEEFNS
ncbi:ribonuclease R family protein [Chroococcidiopsis sp. CCMEE 29]|uniref:ribonuclease R family protein n=1 Tax=Chroococcidiopsis sp. CCMEE 29 TaxID=155894 RepID=UPI0020228ACD|nr:ribonuclease R family protein [Chroococcidiopsis sp. CCMEE 29]